MASRDKPTPSRLAELATWLIDLESLPEVLGAS
jgi:hypothetical protein